mmetsp:Transcript_30503/g.70313  ORF Transcript_30503/g.70313 Transcript_30503/m.70313 type:complete len:251 (-) Transcript_30503:320-1072(-)
MPQQSSKGHPRVCQPQSQQSHLQIDPPPRKSAEMADLPMMSSALEMETELELAGSRQKKAEVQCQAGVDRDNRSCWGHHSRPPPSRGHSQNYTLVHRLPPPQHSTDHWDPHHGYRLRFAHHHIDMSAMYPKTRYPPWHNTRSLHLDHLPDKPAFPMHRRILDRVHIEKQLDQENNGRNELWNGHFLVPNQRQGCSCRHWVGNPEKNGRHHLWVHRDDRPIELYIGPLLRLAHHHPSSTKWLLVALTCRSR